MQAIQVKYLGPTDTKGSRLKAWCSAGQLIDGYDRGAKDPYEDLATKLLIKLGWDKHSKLVQGTLPNGDRVFVLIGI